MKRWQKDIGAMVRDFTSVDYIVRPKSEVRKRINDLIECYRQDLIGELENAIRKMPNRSGWEDGDRIDRTDLLSILESMTQQ
jgi:hypothetical protein